ncbi:hypothetical protein ACA910_008918 [Epithemia clementina (nom. ined.)]
MDKISDHTEQEHQDAVPFPMPSSEAFGHVLERLWPIWQNQMEPQLAQGQTLLLVRHDNSVKAVLHILDPHVVNPQTVRHVKIPNTTPLVYGFRLTETTTAQVTTSTATTTPTTTTTTGDEETNHAAETRPVRENCYLRHLDFHHYPPNQNTQFKHSAATQSTKTNSIVIIRCHRD